MNEYSEGILAYSWCCFHKDKIQEKTFIGIVSYLRAIEWPEETLARHAAMILQVINNGPPSSFHDIED